ncbi:exo-beta-N-acetylmuramidase NamZ domain-containing protein [Mesonia sp. K7]|uniref:exo-beta-N-acetylmuramidase NamZ family protein n=1 Tax=Mesonia sp. K7 TaxID=2218606 RepID=UPI000DA97327|nr:DUF1343 domain-containing protein [Mesonia sp. K7]PZD78061.1 DUF1343 domain-containing protein [Mesonia sp. K7]
MFLHFFKNTFFIFSTVLVSCISQPDAKKKSEEVSVSTEVKSPPTEEKIVVVGANQTELYLTGLRGKKVGIVGNQTSVIFKENGHFTHLVDSLKSRNINITKVFSPEHGFRGKADAGEKVANNIDTKTGIPIVSLYGNNKKPTDEQLHDIDILVFDIQDVGVRFYTYISTLHYVLQAAAENNIEVMVLDRHNPNGHYIDGPMLEKEHQSFVGMHPVPVVHGMTIGEYAQMIVGENWIETTQKPQLTVIKVKNYNKNQFYSLPIKPSPNLPNDLAINLYPSLCFFEGTNVNAGRGTENQFQVFGSPFLNPEKFSYSYIPIANEGAKNPKHLGKTCYGEDLTNANMLDHINLDWLIKAYQNTSKKEEFFNSFLTKLAGTKQLQQQIEAGKTANEIRLSWQADLQAYDKMREKYLMYQ